MSKQILLQLMHERYLATQCPGAILERAVRGERYRVWSVPQTTQWFIYDWKGNKIGTRNEPWKLYVFLGEKGSVKFSLNPDIASLKKTEMTLDNFLSKMKTWAWKHYYNISSK